MIFRHVRNERLLASITWIPLPKFLPPYSPDLNPIDHCWFPLKHAIRKQLPLQDRDLHKAIETVFKQMAEP